MKGITDEKLKNIYPFLDDEDLKKLDEYSRIVIEKGLNAFGVSKTLGLLALMFGTIYLFSTFIYNSYVIIIILFIIWMGILHAVFKNDQKKLSRVIKIIEEISN